jgi:hypothetical protein
MEMDESEGGEAEQEAPEGEGKWRPLAAQRKGDPGVADDGVSDLLAPPDIDAEMEDVDDLFEVTEEDIMGDEDGDLSDLTEVSREDIIGRPPRPRAKRMSRPARPGDGGMQGIGY